jgi:nicotinamidase-related amidase
VTTVLLLIDVQRNMLEPPEPVPAAAEVGPVIGSLLDRARAAGAGVVHVRNCGGPDDPDLAGTPGWELVHDVREGEPVLDKTTCDTFASTELAAVLPPGTDLVVAGMQSDFCVRETSLAAVQRGYGVTLVRGAHATYDGSEPAAAASAAVEQELGSHGVAVVDPGEVVFS